jgi:hypothetical protein
MMFQLIITKEHYDYLLFCTTLLAYNIAGGSISAQSEDVRTEKVGFLRGLSFGSKRKMARLASNIS